MKKRASANKRDENQFQFNLVKVPNKNKIFKIKQKNEKIVNRSFPPKFLLL